MDAGDEYHVMGIPWEGFDIYDLVAKYKAASEKHHKKNGGKIPALGLGKIDGDLTKGSLCQLEHVDVLAGGPPCPP